MDLAAGFLQLSAEDRRDIEDALTTLPKLRGKVSVTFEFNCSAPGVVGGLKILKSVEVLVRR